MVDFKFSGTAYAYAPANFRFGGPASVTGVGALTLDFIIEAIGEHVAPAQIVTGTGALTLALDVAGQAGHGVAGAGELALELTPAAAGGHGVAGVGELALELAPAATVGHGVAGAGALALELTVAAAAVHERYELRGEVRQGGILVSRRVRAYLRSTGALVGETDTVAGRFYIAAGFTPAEHYLVPIDLAADATDWTPPVANRVESVLAMDGA